MAAMTDAFSVRDALAQGVSRERLRSPALDRPFHGTRVLHGGIQNHLDLCRAYHVRMPLGAVFSGVSAAILWGLPLPARFRAPALVEVSRPLPLRPPRGRGVIGRGHDPRRVTATAVSGVPVLAPADTWASLGTILNLADLVAVADGVVTPPFRADAALASVDDLASVVESRQHVQGARRLRRALSLVRVGALSRPETLTRVAAVSAGLPEPVMNHRVLIGDRWVMLDVAWPEFRFALEYEGDGHRARSRFRADLGRVALILDEWDLMRIGSVQLFDRTADTVARVGRRLVNRGWRPSTAFDPSRVPPLSR